MRIGRTLGENTFPLQFKCLAPTLTLSLRGTSQSGLYFGSWIR